MLLLPLPVRVFSAIKFNPACSIAILRVVAVSSCLDYVLHAAAAAAARGGRGSYEFTSDCI